MMGKQVWLSICSWHRQRQADCSMCNEGHWYDQDDLDHDHMMFINDYPGWYAQHNNGDVPSDNAWATWEKLTGGRRPERG